MLTVLLVDDEPNFLEVVPHLLDSAHYEVLPAPDGATALTLCRERRIDILMTDLVMPGMDGLELIRTVRQTWPEIPVIVISGKDSIELAVGAMKLGSVEYIRKPVSREGLLMAIESAREKKWLRDTLQLANEKLRCRLEEQEKDLDKSRTLFQSLVDNSHAILFEIDRSYKVQFCSSNVRQICGFPPEELVGREPDFTIPEDERGEQREYWRKLVSVCAPFSGKKFVWIPPEGPRVVFEVSGMPILDGDGGFVGFSCILSDVTARHQADQELLRLSAAIAHTHESIVLIGLDDGILFANPAFTRETGFTHAEYLGQMPHRLLRSEYGEKESLARIKDMIEKKGHWKGQLVNHRKDGTAYDALLTVSGIRDERGTIIQYVSVGRDVTEENRRELQVRRAQRLDAIGSLASGVAHDFNNIVASISGFANLILQDATEDAETADNARLIQAACQRARTLIQQILLFGGKGRQGHVQVELDVMVREVTALLRSTLPENVTVQLHNGSSSVSILADPASVHQVLLNLCANGIDAMRPGGGVLELSVTADVPAPESPLFPPEHDGLFALLAVSDSGCGMGPDTLARIFEPFFSTKEGGKGTGMGLPLVKRIMEELQGTIRVRTTPGEGSCFEIYFPLPVPEA